MSLEDLRKKLLGGIPKKKQKNPFLDTALRAGAFDFQWRASLPEERLSSDQRGLVIASKIRKESQNRFTITSGIDPQELRFSLLFWDRINVPTNNLIAIGETAEELFLKKAGVLSNAHVIFSGTIPGHAIPEAQINSFRELEKREPGQWSVGRGEESISFGDNELSENRGVLFKLLNSIPVPSEDVHLEDILQFKEKRRSELLDLRHHLGRVYQTILSAEDFEQAIATELSALDVAIANQLKVSKETNFKFKLVNLGAKLDYKSWLVAAAAFGSASAQNLPLSSAIVAGVAGAAVASVSASASITREKRAHTPFEYISRFHSDLFGR